MHRRKQAMVYIFFDLVAAIATWTFFFRYRKLNLESPPFGYRTSEIFFDHKFTIGLLIIPACWVLFYAFTGSYSRVFKKHRFKELTQTLVPTLIGCLIIFFVLILDDQIATYKDYYRAFFILFGVQLGLTLFFRLILTSRTVRRVNNRTIGFNTLIVGGGQSASDIYREIDAMPKSPGYFFKGFVYVLDGPFPLENIGLKNLGSLDRVSEIVKEQNIEEVIIALDKKERKKMGSVLNKLDGQGLSLKVTPDMYDIMSGSVKMTSIYGTPLIEVQQQIMPIWQVVLKRIMDVGVSLFVLILLSPFYLIMSILVKLDSKGPVFFKQERIGHHNKPFLIYKFRSMYVNAEDGGPQLSSSKDSRITRVGKWMRKSRLDEFPQFYNVLIGEMSLVGPRPERQFYIDQIIERAPHYRHLQKVRPGITSWGQVKYGYAENVDEMIQRLKYDVLYIENMSLAVDFKILAYTVLTVLKGSGK